MPTVLRLQGWRFMVYPNDHPPAHIHVLGPGWSVVVQLHDPSVREVIGCDVRHARLVLQAAVEHREALLQAWDRFHG